MKGTMNREELIKLVTEIKDCKGSEQEIYEKVMKLKNDVIYPGVTDLIFYDDKSAEEIVDIVLSYKPILL